MRTRSVLVGALAAVAAATALLPAPARGHVTVVGPLDRVVVIAHRGASAYAPEHTLHAYDLAVRQDADFLECDVHLTRDRVPVCVHDDTVDRTSDGTGPVSRFTLAQLRRLDFGAWFAPGFRGARVVTLEEQLDCYRARNPRLRFHVETKSPGAAEVPMEPVLVDLLRRKGLVPTGRPDPARAPVVIQSFELASLRAVKRLAPGLPTALLWSVPPADVLTGHLPAGVDIAAPMNLHLLADPTAVARFHAHGHPVHVWTVDDAAQVDALLALGVDGVFTNRPDVARARVDAAGTGVPRAARGNPRTFRPLCR